jgi:hypothetical protein
MGVVRTSFEAGRLELVSLRSAYAWVVPVCRRPIRYGGDGTLETRPAPMRNASHELPPRSTTALARRRA